MKYTAAAILIVLALPIGTAAARDGYSRMYSLYSIQLHAAWCQRIFTQRLWRRPDMPRGC